MNINKLIEKKLIRAKEFTKELVVNLNNCGMSEDGSCIVCGANPELFIKYLEDSLREMIQIRDKWWKTKKIEKKREKNL